MNIIESQSTACKRSFVVSAKELQTRTGALDFHYHIDEMILAFAQQGIKLSDIQIKIETTISNERSTTSTS